MPRKTIEERQAESKKLGEMKPNVRHMSAFGDNHHAAIELQQDILEGLITVNKAYDRLYDRAGDGEPPMNLTDAIGDVERWIAGEQDDYSPSESWKELWTDPDGDK